MWFVVTQYSCRSGYYKPHDTDRVFTISEDEMELGWDNHEDALDHGLTRERAEYIVKILNTHESNKSLK